MKKIFYPLLFLLNLAIIFFFWWQGNAEMFRSGTGNVYIALGRLCGLLAVFFVMLQLMLIGRVRYLESVYGLDNLSRLHHLNGQYLITFILLHPIFITFGYSYQNTTFWRQVWMFISQSGDLLQGLLAVILFLFVVVYSILMVRKKWNYEFWYFAHLSTYLAIIFAFGHQLDLGGDFISQKLFVAYWYALYTVAVGNLVLFRFGRPLWNYFRYDFKVDKLVPERGGATSVYITGKNVHKLRAEAGQFVIVRFLDKKRWWQAHPFSLSAVPDGKHLRLTIKALGDFTSEIPNLKIGTRVIIDGPHGIFTASRAKTDKILLVAGGVGITPVRSVLEELLRKGKDVVLLYGSRNEQAIILKEELDDLHNRFPFKLHYIMSDDPAWAGEKGYIDASLIKRLVPDAQSREIFLCAPPALVTLMRKTLIDLQVPHNMIHFEKFSLQ